MLSIFPMGLMWKSLFESSSKHAVLHLFVDSNCYYFQKSNTSLLTVIFIVFRKYGENLLPITRQDKNYD